MGRVRPNTLDDVQNFLVDVVNAGEHRLGTWGGLDVKFYKIEDAVVITRKTGEYLTNLDFSKGGSIIDNWAKAIL